MFSRRTLVVAATLATLALAAPATAHDQLIASDPPAGAELETSPERLVLTYSADILDLSSQVVVTDATGEVLIDSPGEVSGPELTVPIEQPFDAGDYLVTWRVVSSDGHPIDGTFDFTVLNDTEPEADPDPEPELPAAEPEPVADPTTEPTVDPTADPTTEPTAAPEPTEDGSGVPWPVVAGGLGGLLAAAALILLRRRRD